MKYEDVLKSLTYDDLTIKRPKVLLLGNGPFRNCGISWNELLKETARKDTTKYERSSEESKECVCCGITNCVYLKQHPGYDISNSILATATCIECDEKRHQEYVNKLENCYEECDDYSRELVGSILKLPIDAIMTTNYTYEIEDCIKSDYSSLSHSTKLKYAFSLGKVKKDKSEYKDYKYLLSTFNKFSDDTPQIWHIHGEMRRPSSLILNHDEYGRLVHKIIEYNKFRHRNYGKYENFQIRSWFDFFIVADIYILGLGFDAAEFDLWWLLSRRKREPENNVGRIVYYTPDIDSKTSLALQDLGVETKNLGCKFIYKKPCEINEAYKEFYKTAVSDILTDISKDNLSV